MKYLIILTLILLLILIGDFFAVAQSVPPPMLPSGPSQTPIDGGLGLLAAAGGAYALKKLKDRKKTRDVDL